MPKKKKYLITNFQKLNYPIGSELIFIDEILFHLYSPGDKLNYKCSYVNSIEDAHKIKNSTNNIIKKKLKVYRKKLSNLFNFYHKTNNTQKYWGIIIDQFLIELLEVIIVEIKLIQKVKFKTFQPSQDIIKDKLIFSLIDFQYYMLSIDFKKLLSLLILRELDSKIVNFKYTKNSKINIQYKKNFFKSVLKFFIRIYINFFKPVLIVNGYIGLKNSVNFFFRSYGKIINVPENLLFNTVKDKFSLDNNFRKKIKVEDKDIVDKVFNRIIEKVLPCSFLENFDLIKKDIEKISTKINVIATGNCHYYSDHYNILSAEISKKKHGKLLIFQHGGLISKTNQLSIEYLHNTYAFRTYNFDDSRGLGQHFFNQKKLSSEEIKKRNLLLLLNANVYFQRNINYNPATYTHFDPSSVFFDNLNELNKQKTILKLSSKPNYEIAKTYWEKKFNNKINILPTLSNAKKENFYKAKLVILNEVSTALYELIFLGVPFIMICNSKVVTSLQYKKSFNKKLIKLKFINVWFEDPVKAANFVNSFNKSYSIDDWWNKIQRSKIFSDFKKYIIVEKKNYLPKIVSELVDLNKI
jgi:putative transferase (TIGR04331 family)